MPGWLKGLITFVLWAGVPVGVAAAATQQTWLVVVLLIFGIGYGLEAGILAIYDLATPKGWLALVVDMTWSLPNTIWGFTWYFNTESWASAFYQKMAELRVDTWRAGMVTASCRPMAGKSTSCFEWHHRESTIRISASSSSAIPAKAMRRNTH